MRFLRLAFGCYWYIAKSMAHCNIVYPVLNRARIHYTQFSYIEMYYVRSSRSPFYFYCLSNSRARDTRTSWNTCLRSDPWEQVMRKWTRRNITVLLICVCVCLCRVSCTISACVSRYAPQSKNAVQILVCIFWKRDQILFKSSNTTLPVANSIWSFCMVFS